MPPRRRPSQKTKKTPSETVSVGQCKSITVLKNKSRADEAMALLKKIATLMAPIMRKHSWTLPLLCEFFPDRPELLGMNRDGGAQIYIRLRPAHSPDSFYDLEQNLIGTMLHELTHNVHGPHDQKFYAFLDKLQDEYYDLRTGGYTGEGFLSEGKRVGQGVAISDANVPMHVARQKALEQAERRAKVNAVMGPSGGQKLGGAKVDKYRNPRELMAAAAERRIKDQKACKHDDVDVEAEANKAQAAAVAIDIDSDSEEEDEDDHLPETLPPTDIATLSQPKQTTTVLDISSSDSEDAPIASSSKLAGPPIAGSSKATKEKDRNASLKRPSSATSLPGKPAPRLDKPPGVWSCPTCTFDNVNSLALTCELCATPRPFEDADGWRCFSCATVNEHAFWTCRVCAQMKTSSARPGEVLSRSSAVLH